MAAEGLSRLEVAQTVLDAAHQAYGGLGRVGSDFRAEVQLGRVVAGISYHLKLVEVPMPGTWRWEEPRGMALLVLSRFRIPLAHLTVIPVLPGDDEVVQDDEPDLFALDWRYQRPEISEEYNPDVDLVADLHVQPERFGNTVGYCIRSMLRAPAEFYRHAQTAALSRYRSGS